MEQQEKKKRSRKVGSRQDVYAGLAERTAGGLHREDLVETKNGKICTKKEIARGHQLAEYMKNKREQEKGSPESPRADAEEEETLLVEDL